MPVMPGLLMLAIAAVLTTQGDQAPPPAQGTAGAQGAALTLEIRAFNGAEEVTPHTRLTVHRAGDRNESIPHTRSGDGRTALQVPAGIYDVQAIHEREGRVLNIRWANRLVVMPYPDEAGHHLEVINFKNGYGALQVRGKEGARFEVSLYQAGKREKPVASPLVTTSYTLFIVPAGLYDLQVRAQGKTTWMSGLEVPLDRTRLSIIE
jgi:hypothetical protein